MNMESLFEYGSRAGFWRLHRAFTSRKVPVTVYGIAMALERNPDAVAGMLAADWEIATHGYRWIDYQYVAESVEREHIAAAIEIHTRVTGARPLGWYQGRCSPNTHRLVVEEGGFLYNADSYADDLPYWDTTWDKPQHAAGLQLGRPVLRLSEGQFRCALSRGRDPPAHDVGRPALPACRPARPHRRSRTVYRLRSRPRARLGRAPRRRRPALDRDPSVCRSSQGLEPPTAVYPAKSDRLDNSARRAR
jgi:peptidoglycan/xylan/chitin deacetylase (PgdA/CDA1 family)